MRKSITLLLGITIVLAFACSSASGDVASIDTTEATQVAIKISNDDSPIQTDEEKVLEFTQCIRDQGIEIQDATVDSDGNLQPPRPVEGASINRQELRPAFEECRESLDGMTFGRERVDVNELIDNLLEVTGCLRDAGFDVDDPNQENLGAWRRHPVTSRRLSMSSFTSTLSRPKVIPSRDSLHSSKAGLNS
jgi:hypothetical protein